MAFLLIPYIRTGDMDNCYKLMARICVLILKETMKNNNKLKIIMFMGFLVLCIVTFYWVLRFDRFGLSNIKWGDYVKYNGITYAGQYNENDERIIVSEQDVGELIGMIKFKLQGNVHNPYYKMRNKDATILAEGIELYKILNEDSKRNIAVKIGEEYYLYIYDSK
ncbi:MAG: hypothetical protein K0S61_3100 [Anaerocolumna sp.]|jgi:hypothetical protein|nr:hypothetical protein [Anaerocolumna sp.]